MQKKLKKVNITLLYLFSFISQSIWKDNNNNSHSQNDVHKHNDKIAKKWSKRPVPSEIRHENGQQGNKAKDNFAKSHISKILFILY